MTTDKAETMVTISLEDYERSRVTIARAQELAGRAANLIAVCSTSPTELPVELLVARDALDMAVGVFNRATKSPYSY